MQLEKYLSRITDVDIVRETGRGGVRRWWRGWCFRFRCGVSSREVAASRTFIKISTAVLEISEGIIKLVPGSPFTRACYPVPLRPLPKVRVRILKTRTHAWLWGLEILCA